MMNSNVMWMVLGIVLIVSITQVLKARMGVRKDRWGNEVQVGDDGEARRAADEIRTLKERVAVLERIATDRNHTLEHEIERLRDR